MGHRTSQRSAHNGPTKLYVEVITRCLDCPRLAPCQVKDRGAYPATEIADGCPLPDAPGLDGDAQ